MHPVWAQRREDVLRDCLVSPDVCTQIVDRLGEFVMPYQHVLETEASQRNVHLYLQGLLSHLPGKNAEDIATFVNVERQVIQDFIGTVPWDHRPLVAVFVGQVAEQLGEPDGILAFDPSSFPKRGTHSVGVKRQWCSHRGKVDNCQVGVFMGYVSRHDYALLDFRLSLPQEWARDEPRRQACHMPPEVRYHMRHEQCVEMLDLWGKQSPHGWVTGDDALGRHTRLRHELRERGERYLLGVPCTTTIRDLEAPLPAYAGRGRPPKAPWRSVAEWRQTLPGDTWTRLTVRDGEKGPVEIALVRRRVQTRIERKRMGPQEWLVVTRRPLTDDSRLDTQASREACEQETRYGYRYDLTPTQTPASELVEPSLAELARVIKAGGCMEASFKRGTLLLDSGGLCADVVRESSLVFKAIDKEGLEGGESDKSRVGHHRQSHDPGIQQEPRGKSEAGMDAYQVRTWEGWHHHMALTLIAVWFLISETHRGQQLAPALTLPQVRYGLSVLLMEVCCTPGMDAIAVKSSVNYCATSWRDSTIIAPGSAYHR